MSHINESMVIGLGGVGSAFIGPYAALLANDPNCQGPEDDKGVPMKPRVLLVDGDSYEEKNLRNQDISPQDVGQNKADVAATRISGMVDADVWTRYITGPLEIQSWLVSQRSKQDERINAGLFGGVAVIVLAVDNDHCRNYIYRALEEVPKVSVLIIDPANGSGADATDVDVVTYLRVYDGEETLEVWPSPFHKYKQLQKPKGIPQHEAADCAIKARTEPQLRTANMMAALLAYDCLRRWLEEDGMVEGYHADVGKWTVGQIGSRLPTATELEEVSEEEADALLGDEA